MPTAKARERAEHLIQILEGLKRHDPWPPTREDVADVCRRAFQLTEELASDAGTSLSVCFLPTFHAGSQPEALCCQCIKAVSDLHTAALEPGGSPDSRRRAEDAIGRLVEGLGGLTAAGRERAAGARPVKKS